MHDSSDTLLTFFEFEGLFATTLFIIDEQRLDELNQLVDEELTDVSITPGQMFYDTS